jgi:hypothetical protein
MCRMTPLHHLAEAYDHAVAAGAWRVELRIDNHGSSDMPPSRRRGGLLRPVGKAAAAVGRAAWARLKARLPLDLRGEGVLDLAGRRWMVDYGSYAELDKDGRTWSGRSGRRISTLEPDPSSSASPLWLLDLLAGVTEVDDPEESGDPHGRRLVAHADLREVARRLDIDPRIPGEWTLGEPPTLSSIGQLETEVWLDDEGLVRRVRFARRYRTLTLDLIGPAVADELDWTRLPTFRSPDEAAGVASAEGAGR